ncbi:MAG: hypothetical protein C4558_06920 [Dehalococcoidia bacterium]|nr:MAG: hypothetical protein C4558_06920 [Dehalococcoidia bacterium]
MIGNANSEGDGFGGLWALVIEQARQGIVADFSAESRAFIEQAPPIEQGPTLAKQLGIKNRYTKALEAGVACRLSIFRIANTKRISDSLDPHSPLAPEIEWAVIDALSVYLSAYIDGVQKFVAQALGQLVPEDLDTAQRRNEVRAWSAAAKKSLSTTRQAVAHAEPGSVSGLTKDGLWAPLILLGATTEDSLREMFNYNLATNHVKFQSRTRQMFQVAMMALAQGEAQMSATAKLIGNKIAARRAHIDP